MADNSNRGLANADEETRQRAASMGGQASPASFDEDKDKAKRAGKKGGKRSGNNR